MTRRLAKRTLATLAGLSLVAALSACGNDTSATSPSQAYLGAAKSVVGSVRGKASGAPAAQAVDPHTLIAQALAATDGQIMIMGIEATQATMAIGPVTRNGTVVTWKTADRRSFSFDRGVLAGTRGFGDDLMSIDADPSIALVTSRRSGRVPRVNYYLSGLGNSAALTLDCTVTVGGRVHLAVGEINTTTTHMVETCQRDGLSVENQYWVDGRGKILKSRQWVGQRLGYIITQQLRP